MINHMSSKLWDEITYTFSNFNGYTVQRVAVEENDGNFVA